MRLGAGAVHGFLLLFGAIVDHGVGHGVGHGVVVQVFDTAEGFFDEAATAETPGSSHDFEGEDLFGCVFGREFGHEGGEDFGVFFFSFADEIVGREEAEFENVAGGFGFAFFGAGAGGAARVSDEVVCMRPANPIPADQAA